MHKSRPVNLDLRTIKFPLPAVVSILHRVSGVLLFLFTPILIYMLSLSMHNSASFAHLTRLLSNPFFLFVIWVGLSALLFHIVAGIRHLFMDCGYGESLSAARNSAIGVFMIAALLIILAGVWLC